MTSLDLYRDAALSRGDSRRMGRSLTRLDGQTIFDLARIDQVTDLAQAKTDSVSAAWWWLGPQSPAERRYHANVERRAAERRIGALVRQGMACLLDEAQRQGRAGQ